MPSTREWAIKETHEAFRKLYFNATTLDACNRIHAAHHAVSNMTDTDIETLYVLLQYKEQKL